MATKLKMTVAVCVAMLAVGSVSTLTAESVSEEFEYSSAVLDNVGVDGNGFAAGSKWSGANVSLADGSLPYPPNVLFEAGSSKRVSDDGGLASRALQNGVDCDADSVEFFASALFRFDGSAADPEGAIIDFGKFRFGISDDTHDNYLYVKIGSTKTGMILEQNRAYFIVMKFVSKPGGTYDWIGANAYRVGVDTVPSNEPTSWNVTDSYTATGTATTLTLNIDSQPTGDTMNIDGIHTGDTWGSVISASTTPPPPPPPSPPGITDWWSTGGTPQYKDNVKDLIYKIAQGDSVTFSVTAGGTGTVSYAWKAMKGSQLVATSSAGNTFTWTIPSEAATWDVKVTIFDSGSKTTKHLVWSITTSDVKTVNPGESIQAAIDALPAEGGIVELTEGTWTLTAAADATVIKIIQRHNVTLRGAGADKTVLQTASEDVCLVVVSPLADNDFIIHEAGGGAAQQDPRLINAPFYKHIVIRDIHFIGPGVRVETGKRITSILYAKIYESTIEDVLVEKFGDSVLLYRCNYNVLEGMDILESNCGGLFFSMCADNRIENCLFERANRWYAFDLNGGGVRNKIIGNIFRANGQGDLKLYSGTVYNEIIGNTFDGAGSSNGGVIIMNGSWNLIQGNIFTNHRKIVGYAAVVQKSGGGSHPPEHYNHDNKVINNTFYDSKGDAVLLVVGATMEVRNNIIVKSGEKAINGIDPANCSYNNLWQNVGGDTGGGTGSISADPLFADPDNVNFYLKSKTGRWDPNSKTWVKDSVHSPCIDKGRPSDNCSKEPNPNGGVINMGAYGNTDKASKSETAETVGRYVFYNNSAFDGNNAAANADDDGAIAPDKTALLPGNTATFANYTSYSKGINGIMIDIAGLPGTPTASDFTFKVGNDNTPASWATATAPTSITIREGAGVDGSDRITIVWTDNAIQKQWLQVTVKATTATGLASDDVFYFGNAIGETGNSATDAMVKPTDEIGARNNPHSLGGPEGPAGIDDVYDFDRDKKVGPTDEIIARNNGTNSLTALQLITAP